MQVWLAGLVWNLLGGLKDILLGFFKGTVKGVLIFGVVGYFIDQIIGYVSLFMAPFLVFAGPMWIAFGGDVVMYIVVTTLKLKITLKVLQTSISSSSK